MRLDLIASSISAVPTGGRTCRPRRRRSLADVVGREHVLGLGLTHLREGLDDADGRRVLSALADLVDRGLEFGLGRGECACDPVLGAEAEALLHLLQPPDGAPHLFRGGAQPHRRIAGEPHAAGGRVEVADGGDRRGEETIDRFDRLRRRRVEKTALGGVQRRGAAARRSDEAREIGRLFRHRLGAPDFGETVPGGRGHDGQAREPDQRQQNDPPGDGHVRKADTTQTQLRHSRFPSEWIARFKRRFPYRTLNETRMPAENGAQT